MSGVARPAGPATAVAPRRGGTRRRLGALAVGLAVVSATLTAAGTAGATLKGPWPDWTALATPHGRLVEAAGSTTTGDCGGTVMAKPGGGDWTCSFDDEFAGSSLDTADWAVQQTATSGYTTGTGAGTVCYTNAANDVSVSGGVLHLTVRKLAKPMTCDDPDGDFTTQYTGGMVTTDGLFSQADGLFEVRAKLPATALPGLQETLWLWPADPKAATDWPLEGEIDFAEFYSEFSLLDIPFVHYDPAGLDPNQTTLTCLIGHPGQFNTYSVMWTPTALTIGNDGTTCLVDQWDPAPPQVAPAPFDAPFVIDLTQALGVGTNLFVPGVTPLPATTEVDWVRVWQ